MDVSYQTYLACARVPGRLFLFLLFSGMWIPCVSNAAVGMLLITEEDRAVEIGSKIGEIGDSGVPGWYRKEECGVIARHRWLFVS